MPWISDELEDWDELSDEEQERVRALLRDLGEVFDEEDDDDYYE